MNEKLLQNPEYLMVLGVVSQMSQEDQEKIKVLKEKIKDVFVEDNELGLIALVLTCTEIQVQV